ncbi:palmitoyltransferase akr1 [Marasmius crinis-equi]|uniref:Palmitoyltransferase akr1 n=1 Tax=Marasmius crinis-equi TaxID=585013 RepID=A0ABR3EUX9_9AGAR
MWVFAFPAPSSALSPLMDANSSLCVDFASSPIYSATPTTPSTCPPGTPPTTSARDPDSTLDISSSCFDSTDLCLTTQYDTFLVSVTAWANLQLSWTIVLLASQFWQIVKRMTTLEVVNLGGYGFMGGRGGSSMQGQMGHSHSHGRGRGQGKTLPSWAILHPAHPPRTHDTAAPWEVVS